MALLLHSGESGDAPREIGLAVRRHEAADQLVLELRHLGRAEVDLLQELVHRAADLGPRPLSGGCLLDFDGPLAHPEAVAGEILVRALLEHRERREREPAHAEERRVREDQERRQLGSGGQRGDLLQRGEQRELSFLRLRLLLLFRLEGRFLRPVAV